MKPIVNLCFVAIHCFIYMSCKMSPDESQDLGKPLQEPKQVLSSFNHWWNYQSKFIKFYEPMEAFDTESKSITKQQYIDELITGNYIPIKYYRADSSIRYKLFRLDNTIDPNISAVIRSTAKMEKANFALIGKPLPDFNFTDLNQNHYNSTNTKGKIIIAKFWFIGCTACVAEMPELNSLYKQYSKRPDVTFLSLAFDDSSRLRKFLTKREFLYPVIADQESYVIDTLQMTTFPTHLIVGKNGLVSNVVNSYEDLVEVLKYELAKK